MNSENYVTSLLDQSSFVVVNEKLIKILKGDCTTAVLLSRLISLHKFYKDTGHADEFFYQKVKDIEDKLGINDYFQRKSFDILKELGFINMKLEGSPPLRKFSINFITIHRVIANEFLSDKPKKPSMKASEFYKQINENNDPTKVLSVSGNISHKLSIFLFVFKTALNNVFSGWNPENYGRISTYLNRVYFKPKRPFSYHRLRNWMMSQEPKTVANFIKFDQHQIDGLDEEFVTAEQYLKEL